MKQPFYPAEWAIKIQKERTQQPLIHGNLDLLNANAAHYYSYRRSMIEYGARSQQQERVPAK